MKIKWIMEVKVMVRNQGETTFKLEFRPVHCTGEKEPYMYDTATEAESMLNICYREVVSENKRIRAIEIVD